MARLPYLSPDDLADADRELLSRPGNLFRLLVHSPDGFRNFSRLGGWIRDGSTFDPRLRELAILQVGYLTSSPYEWTHHIRIGRDVGVSDDDLAAIEEETAGGRSLLAPLDRAVLAAARELVDGTRVGDATWTVLSAHLPPEHLVDLVLTVSFYCMVVRVLGTFGVDVEADYIPLLEQFPLPDALS